MHKLWQVLLSVCLLGTSLSIYADNRNEVSQNINNLVKQIRKINDDLQATAEKKRQIDSAINHSDGAIDQAEKLLAKLKREKSASLKQIRDLESALPQLLSQTAQAESSVHQTISQIYRKMVELNTDSSLMTGNNTAEAKRKKSYLSYLLKIESDKFKQLNEQLTQLQALNQQLQEQLARLDQGMNEANQKKSTLLVDKQQKLAAANQVEQEINQKRARLAQLNKQQADLNRLLNRLAASEDKKSAARATQGQTVKVNTNNIPNNSSAEVLTAKFIRPIKNSEGKVIIGFGQMRDSVRNNGILFKVDDNASVYAAAAGKVLHSGELAGFGRVVVINHANKYTSVYSGIIAKVSTGDQVAAGQAIASSGTAKNQPMGGVYFEVRRLGKPVNPSNMIN